MTISRAVTDLL